MKKATYNELVELSTLDVELCGKRRRIMAQKLSKEERKAMARKAMEKRAKQPKPAASSGFAKLDADAKNLR